MTKGYCQVRSRRGSYMAVELEEGDLAKCPARPFHFWALINLSYSQRLFYAPIFPLVVISMSVLVL